MDLPFMPSQIELWPIERLRPYARNARLHSDNQVAVLAANMLTFGWTMPCMISDDGELISGHGRILAATKLGLSKIPVMRMSHLDEDKRRALRVSDNSVSDLAEWDELNLGLEIIDLQTLGFDTDLLGFSPEFLDNHGSGSDQTTKSRLCLYSSYRGGKFLAVCNGRSSCGRCDRRNFGSKRQCKEA